MTRVRDAPAKINLGLEILRRRGNGYHDVRTILCTISLADRLTFEPADSDEIVIHGAGDVPRDGNLVLRALREMRERGAEIPPQRVTVDKAIPAAAGLGGASSDAAATIDAFLPELDTTRLDPFEIAAALGSDVPFFLDGPIALASGRGEILDPLIRPRGGWVVLAMPGIEIPDKTRTMYAAVDPAWWSDGARVDAIAQRLPALPAEAPFNVFEGALANRFPEATVTREALIAAGAPFAALTGAGPTHYALLDTESAARGIAGRMVETGLWVRVARLGGGDD